MHKFVFLCILVSSCIVSQTSVSVVCFMFFFVCFYAFCCPKTSVSVVCVFIFFFYEQIMK